MDKKLQEALNEQMNREYESAYIYKAMEVYFAENDLDGSKNWMNLQAAEELQHGEIIRNFLHDVEVPVTFRPINVPTAKYNSVLEVFKAALEHERFISNSIKDIYKLALEVNDIDVQIFLNQFIREQVEEEATVKAIVSKFEKVGDSISAIYMIDSSLGDRTQAGNNTQA